jgi:arylsulfatase A-like enzyme
MTVPNAPRQISRRTLLHLSAGSIIATTLPTAVCPGQSPGDSGTSTQRPNIVFILADDLGWADVGYHGSEIQTPNIDGLARKGVRFRHHYAMATCTPTRVGLMTGRYPSRYGVTAPDYGKIFDDDTLTLAEVLHRGGYATSISGKWHMGSPPDWTPRKYGFDSSYGYFHGQLDPYVHDYKTGVPSWHRNDRYIEEKGHATDLIANEAVRIIESRHDQPFFLYVTFSVPHHPLDEPAEWTERYEGRIPEPSRRWFAASVTHMDHGIGRIVEAVDRQGLRQNTLIVFSSDNGGQGGWSSATEYQGRYRTRRAGVGQLAGRSQARRAGCAHSHCRLDAHLMRADRVSAREQPGVGWFRHLARPPARCRGRWIPIVLLEDPELFRRAAGGLEADRAEGGAGGSALRCYGGSL